MPNVTILTNVIVWTNVTVVTTVRVVTIMRVSILLVHAHNNIKILGYTLLVPSTCTNNECINVPNCPIYHTSHLHAHNRGLLIFFTKHLHEILSCC